MKTITKVLCGAGVLALAGLIPYRFESDKETGSYKVTALLWNLQKTPGEETDTYVVDVLPFIQTGAEAEAEEAAAEEADEAE